MPAFGSAQLDPDITGTEAPEMGEFSKGLRSGLYGAGSQLQSFAGGIGAAAGADEFAAGRNAEAAALQAEAQRYAPRVTSYKEGFSSLRNFGDYAAGLAGQAVPSVAAGVGAGALTAMTGGGALAALGAGALTQAPLEIGDVLQRQQLDPTARTRGAGENLRDAVLTGGASALGQAIVPAALGGKLVGKGVQGGLRALEREGIKEMGTGGITRAMLRDAAIEGASEAGGELTKQQGVQFGAAPDYNAALEAGVGGALVGGGMGAVGHGADTFHENRGAMADSVRSLAERGTQAVKDVAAKARPEADIDLGPEGRDYAGAAQAAKNVAGDLAGRVRQAFAPRDTTVDDVERGDGILNKNELAEISDPMTARERAGSVVREGMKRARDWASKTAADLMDKVPPEAQERMRKVAEGAVSAGDDMWVATQKKAVDAARSVKSKAQEFSDFVAKNVPQPKTSDAKKSEDYSGIRQAIVDNIRIADEADATSINIVADGIRQFLDASGSMNDAKLREAVERLRPLLGEDTEEQLMNVYQQVLGDGDEGKLNKFAQSMTRARDERGSRASLRSVIESSAQDSGIDVDAATDALVTWARSGHDPKSAQASFANDTVHNEIKRMFGDKADAVYDALEAHVDSSAVNSVYSPEEFAERQLSDDAEREIKNEKAGSGSMAEAKAQRVTYGTTYRKGDTATPNPMMSPELHEATYPGDVKGKARPRPAADLIKKLQAKYPNKDVRWISSAEFTGDKDRSTTHGFVVVEDMPQEGTITDSGFRGARLDTDKYAESRSRFEVKVDETDAKLYGVRDGSLKLDAVKLAREGMNALRATNASDGTNDAVRLSRGFFESISQVYDKFGTTPKFPDGGQTVIGYIAKKPFTINDAKKLDIRTQADIDSDTGIAAQEAKHAKATEDRLDGLRRAFASMKGDATPEAAKIKAALTEEAANVKAQAVEDAEARRSARVLVGDERDTSRDADKEDVLSGRYETDEGANIHERAMVEGERGDSLAVQGERSELRAKLPREVQERAKAAITQANAWMDLPSAAAQQLGRRAEGLLSNLHALSTKDRNALLMALEGKPSEGATAVNALHRKYGEVLAVPKPEAAEPKRAEPAAKTGDALDMSVQAPGVLGQKAHPLQTVKARLVAAGHPDIADMVTFISGNDGALPNREKNNFIDRLRDAASASEARAVVNEFDTKYGGKLDNYQKAYGGTPRPKAQAAKKAALDQAASSSDPALLKELRTTEDAPALQRTAAYLAKNHPDSEAARVAGEHFDQLVQDPDTAYSLQRAHPGNAGPVNRQDVAAYLQRVLGNSVALAWDNLPHAGEFERDATGDVIRLSVHALNPKSVAYHESLHAFFAQLRDAQARDPKATKVAQVLEKAASQNSVKRWMENHFANEPAVLRQIRSDAEERAAYMYQLWASEPSFRAVLNPQATSVFAKVAEFIRSMLGIWSNDQRALHIMEHFHSGQYAQNIGRPNTVALLGAGTNHAVEQLKAMSSSFTKVGDSLFGAGSARLRDTGNAALIELADLIKPTVSGSENVKTGFLAAARAEFTTRLNGWGESLGQPTQAQLAQALEVLQGAATSTDAAVNNIVDKTREALQSAGGYMRGKGVDFGNLGPDYFPRVWDAHAISQNQSGFLRMMDSYVQSGLYRGDPRELMNRLVANDGNNFAVDTRQPGMQHTKERELDFIVPSDAAPFLSKDLYQTMSSYISQASRRAEWAGRFGGDGEGYTALLDRAKREGATKDQLDMAERYVKGVQGTLGDGINPAARRLIGNAIIYQNLRLLPLAIFSSVVDPVGIVVRGGTVGEAWGAFKRGVREVPLNFKKYDANARDEATLMAETLGTIENASLMHSLGALYSQGMTGSMGRKVNDTFFRFNLMEQYNRSMRVSATEAAIDFIQRHAAGIDPKNSKRFLAELGLEASDVQTNPTYYPGANGQLRQRIKLTEDDGLTPAEAVKMRDAVNKWVDGAILRPDQADKPIWFNDPHYALVSHLKQFTYAFHHTIIDRVVREAKEGNYKPAAALASYVPVMIAADYLKGFVQGGGDQPAWKRDWGPSDYLWNGVQRAGLLGVGQFGVDAAGRGLGTLSGPTLEQLGDATDVMGGTGRFNSFFLDAMPANALYSAAFKGSHADAMFTE